MVVFLYVFNFIKYYMNVSLKCIKKIHMGIFTPKSTNNISLRGIISTFFVFKIKKCRGPPPINLFKKIN